MPHDATPPLGATRRRLLATALFGAAAVVGAPRIAWGQNAGGALPHAARIEQLIAAMTIEEKAGQLNLLNDPFRFRPQSVNPTDGEGDPARVAAEIRAGRIGNLFNGVGAETGREIQRIAVEESRLKIPLLFAADIIHGLFTVFPVPLAEASSWDTDLAYRTARAAAVEGAASAIHQTYAPMVDVGRDQRWGRVVEGAGEDVLLNNLMSVARTRGFQGERGLADPQALLATPKHIAAYGAAEAGLDYNTVDMSEAQLKEVYLPPFKAAFEAGALSTMSAFNDINGIPATGNEWLLTELLRGEWGFEGFVVSDYTSEQELIAHGFAADGRDAARIALLAGVDMSMVSGLYLEHIPDLVASGDVPMAVVDRAVRRVLSVKAALGLFDDPYRGTGVERERREVGTAEHYALAREAGRRSVVMLKNDGDLLPLPKSGKRIALIGPFGPSLDVFGPWTIWGDESKRVSVEQGFREAMADPSLLTVVEGSGVEEALDGGIEAAVAAAREADIVVLAIGESQGMSAEAQSRADIVVPPPQQALAKAVAATGKPVVVLLRNGRALELSGAVRDAPAILVTWFLGSEMGRSVADIVFGDHAPDGRLPVSFPQLSGQQPFYYSRKTTGRPASSRDEGYKAQFREVGHDPLYPFGHGLTYGAVTYGAPSVGNGILPWDGSLEVSVQVTNTGRRAASEVVQLYIRDRVATMTQPRQLLKDFKRVQIAPGATETVRFTLRREQLLFVGRDLEWTVEPGEFDLWLAPSAEVGEPARFTLVE